MNCIYRKPVVFERAAMRPIGLVVAASIAWQAPVVGQSLFQPLGIPPGGTGSAAYGVSADGGTIVGGGPIPATAEHAWWWRQSQGFNLVPGMDVSTAHAISGDGTVVVGESSLRAFRYHVGGAAELLPGVPIGAGGTMDPAYACSADGSVIVGTVRYSIRIFVPGRYDASGYILPPIPSGAYGDAYGVSGDGSVVVGRYYDYGSASGPAFRWTAAGGTVGLGYLGVPQGSPAQSIAYAVSPDGQVIVGWSTTQTDADAFRWTAATGMVGIGGPLRSASALATNADGSMIVGRCQDGAFIWDPVHGAQLLWRVLLASGAGSGVQGWTLFEARGVSADGRTIVGNAVDPQGRYEAFVVQLSLPVPCYTNCDGSTQVPLLNVNDFLCFQYRFAAGDPYANCDASTTPPVLNVNDFVCFMTQFAAGC